jgi:hypothetical protein
MYEYDEKNPDTWKYQELPDVPESFQRQLISIAGLNRHGQPNLRAVKGNEVLDDRTELGGLKYHCGYSKREVAGYKYVENGVWKFTEDVESLSPAIIVFPDVKQEELGLLRYVIERWTSPEELESQSRFSYRYAPGDLTPTLRTFPREGIYDTYFIVQTQGEKFKQLTGDVLDYLRFKWNYDLKSNEEKEVIRAELHERELRARTAEKDERIDAALRGDLTLPKEELERREEYWETRHDYLAEAKRISETSTFYQ